VTTLLLSVPIKAGQSDIARAFAHECVGPRLADYDASERRINITTENWYLQRIGDVDHFTLYIEGPDLNASLGAFIASRDPFDMWFKEQFLGFTGVDLNAPPPDGVAAELLAEYRVGASIAAQR
jgi:hypothetical protein